MNHLKENPVGLDAVIHKIQVKLYDKLSELWGTTLDGYPRCYSIKREAKKTIEHYKGKGEYISLIHAEKNKFFFLADSDYTQESLNHYSSKVDLYFILNLNKCKFGIQHRADEEIKRDIINIVSYCENVGENIKIVTGVDAIFMGFQRNEIDDIHPYYFFKAIIDINDFSLNKTLCQ